jgi:hypothetical protein
MSKSKNQHYVPQFYLRNFSANRKSINLFNLSTGRIVIGDSIKNQCSEDYFYGKTIPIEKAFSEIETSAGSLIKKIINENYIPPLKTQDHSILQVFIVSLHSRTKYKADEINEMADRMGKSFLELHPDVDKQELDKFEIKLDFPLGYSIVNAFTKYHLIQDLSIHLLLNKSTNNFITSDQPVILYNKWAEDLKEYGSVGLASKGLMIFLPLSSRKLLILYDKGVYKIGNKKDLVSILNDDKEIDNINLMQWLRCRDNIYFTYPEDKEKILSNAKANIPLRQQSKMTFKESVGSNGSKIFGGYSTKLRMNLKINSIRVKKHSRKNTVEDKILAIRNPKLFELAREFSDLVKSGHYSSLDWNKFLEDKVQR